jgi:hypothetical protein
MTTRYCPSCAGIHENAYTTWEKTESLGCEYEYCEHDDRTTNKHYTFIIDGEYWFDIVEVGDFCGTGCDAVRLFDDGVECCRPVLVHADLWELMIDAIGKEATAGTFDPAMWKANLPRRTFELVEVIKKAAAAALADKLPPVLVGIVSAYLW